MDRPCPDHYKKVWYMYVSLFSIKNNFLNPIMGLEQHSLMY